MIQQYNAWLVSLSVIVAVFASYTALELAARIPSANIVAAKWWLIGGSVAMGLGIWAMHFIGMLALVLPIQLSYDVTLTILSMVLPVVVSGLALRTVSFRSVTGRSIVLAGVVMGAGICSMHYIGMHALRVIPAISYDHKLMWASFAIAIGASLVALWLAFHIRIKERTIFSKPAGAVVMGVAIAGMHYTGMASAQFAPDAHSAPGGLVDSNWLAGGVALITFGVLAGTMLIVLFNAKLLQQRQVYSESLETAEATGKARDQFLVKLSHEIRNPIAAIVNAAHLLEGETSPRNIQLAKEIIQRQAFHLNRMLEDLLDVSRVLSGKIHLYKKPMALHQEVTEVLQSIDLVRKSGRPEIALSSEPVWIDGDATRIAQLITNLITNAVNHTQPGGKIEVSVSKQNATAVIRVADNGMGIPAEILPNIFELFYQGPNQVEPTKMGFGIGLNMVRGIVELHDGSVHVASRGPGLGAEFTVLLPAIAQPRPG
jgi:diguanylate cyclase